MKRSPLSFGMAALTLLAACDSATSSLGGSLIPETDQVSVSTYTCTVPTTTILSPDSLLDRNSTCYLGRYTDPYTSLGVSASYLTQLNCVENFTFPDSVYGIGNHKFPEFVEREMEGVAPYKAQLRLFFSSQFGDPENSFKVEVFPLNKILSPSARYYADINPEGYYDSSLAPLASATIAAVDYTVSDSIRSRKDHYKNVLIQLPDSLAEFILNEYYAEGGKAKFADAESFANHICKGFYLRCVQGDGTLLAIDKTVLEVNFKYLEVSSSGKADSLLSVVAEFTGNQEVMQVNHFERSNKEVLLADQTGTYINTPFGLLTEITLPVDSMKSEEGSFINAASLTMYCMRDSNRNVYKPSVPPTVLLVKSGFLHKFFEYTNSTDNTLSYTAAYDSKNNSYSFANISKLVEYAYNERTLWLKHNGYAPDSEEGRRMYAATYPDWNKAVLVPVSPLMNSQNEVLGYNLDVNLHHVKLVKGVSGGGVSIKIIKSVL